MSPQEIHQFGTNMTADHLIEQGCTNVLYNYKLDTFPQITATYRNRLLFVIVKTAVYPETAWIESEEERGVHLEEALRDGAASLFSRVQVRNSKARTEAEKGIITACEETSYELRLEKMEELTTWEQCVSEAGTASPVRAGAEEMLA
jgi:hypothetical protein